LSLLQNDALLAMAFKSDSIPMTLFSIAYSLPMVLFLVLYFRFIFGFFMRNSERQADLYALKTVGHPYTLISSLEKIAYASGRIHDVPSWHHYSIRERIEFLWRSFQDPSLPRRHDRKLYGAAALFVVVVALLTWSGPVLQKTETVRQWRYHVELKLVENSLQDEPENAQLQAAYGGLLLELERYSESEAHLLRALELEPANPTILNNLAWLYATAPPPVANSTAALELAKDAIQLKPEPFVWDTLAEAYYANGLYEESLEAIKQAILMGTDNRAHYLKQKKKIEEALKRRQTDS
jgi:tetratricopeptide (TPR) repeat protein